MASPQCLVARIWVLLAQCPAGECGALWYSTRVASVAQDSGSIGIKSHRGTLVVEGEGGQCSPMAAGAGTTVSKVLFASVSAVLLFLCGLGFCAWARLGQVSSSYSVSVLGCPWGPGTVICRRFCPLR